MSKVMGIDLAGLEKNDTGICSLIFSEDKEIAKVVKVKKVKTDAQILSEIEKEMPLVVAIDAPLSLPKRGMMRSCDKELQQYGAISPLLGGMKALTERAIELKRIISESYEVIEVNAKIGAKMLGYYNKDTSVQQKALIEMGIEGDIKERILSEDEIDAISAAIIAYLYVNGKCMAIGGEDGYTIVPKL